jgi:predicted DNA-binding transcriptional regulator YafY
MFVSEDGTVTGSIDVSKLDEIEPKSDEAKAQLAALKAERDAGQKLAAADAERVASQHEAQAAQLTGEQDSASDQSGSDQSQQPDDLNQLSKAELVDRANAQGVDTAGKTKSELVEALGGSVA